MDNLTVLEQMLLQELLQQRDQVAEPINAKIRTVVVEIARRVGATPEEIQVDLKTGRILKGGNIMHDTNLQDMGAGITSVPAQKQEEENAKGVRNTAPDVQPNSDAEPRPQPQVDPVTQMSPPIEGEKAEDQPRVAEDKRGVMDELAGEAGDGAEGFAGPEMDAEVNLRDVANNA